MRLNASVRTDLGAVVTLVAVALLTSVVGLGQASLWETDEPLYVEASREMLETGNLLTPSFNGEPRFQKPILFYWMQVSAYWLFGVSEWSARLPVALSAFICAVLLYLMGKHLTNAVVGLMAATAFLTMFRVAVFSRQAMTDIPVLMFILLALYGFVRSLDEGVEDDPGRSKRFARLAWVGMALGVLTKGPMGLLPLMVWVPFLIVSRQWRGFRRLDVEGGLITFLAIATPWYAYMIWRHGMAYLDVGLMSEVVARVASSEFGGPSRGVLYYFSVWPPDMTPWTPFFLGGIGLLAVRWSSLEPDVRRAGLLALTWFVVIQVVFAGSTNKQPHYILPAYPPAALVVALLFDTASRLGGTAPRRILRLTGLVLGIVAVGLSGLTFAFLTDGLGNSLTSPALLFPLVTGIGGVLIPLAHFQSPPRRAFAVTAGVTAVAYGILGLVIVPTDLERLKPIKPLGALMARESEAGDRVGLLQNVSRGNVVSGLSAVYYTGRPIRFLSTVGQAAAFLRGPGRAFCLMDERDYQLIRNTYDQRLHVLGKGDLFMMNLSHLFGEGRGTRTLVVVSNRSG